MVLLPLFITINTKRSNTFFFFGGLSLVMPVWKDTAGSVKLWEITRGIVIEDYGKVTSLFPFPIFCELLITSLQYCIPYIWKGS